MAERAANPAAAAAPPPLARRPFLVRFAAAVIGGIVIVIPAAAGLLTFFDPLRRQSGEGRWFRVGRVDTLRPGAPERVTIVGDRRDSWTDYRQEPLGAIFLVAEPDGKSIKAFNATCPHAGCSVAFQAARECFVCPCHTSAFDLAGAPISAVPPRGMDSLECETRGQGEIWVKYEDFLTGTSEKIRKA
ncbi:MAG TPA: Rieske (2Fe-2S) protein [Pirellulales bacterium]|nr:Rieske (2Fe-2S) protein [Pirellulales bacterium]